MKQATFIKDVPGRSGTAKLYQCNPPLDGHDHVVVSALTLNGEPEAYIFPADAAGRIMNYAELEGSLKGTLSHTTALRNAGYVLNDDETTEAMLLRIIRYTVESDNVQPWSYFIGGVKTTHPELAEAFRELGKRCESQVTPVAQTM